MYRTVEALAALGHTIQLVAFEEKHYDPGPLARMASVVLIPLRKRPVVVGALSTLANRRPYTQLKREVVSAYRVLDRLQGAQHFDVVLADEIHVASYGAYMKRHHGVPYLLRAHNVQHEMYRHHTKTVANPLMREYFKLQTGRWRRFEVEQFLLADVLAAMTPQDEKVIGEMVPGRLVRSLPAAVDVEAFPYRGPTSRERHSMLMLGDMKWPANRDAALWFTREILPLIVSKVRDAKLYLLGSAAPVARLPVSGNLEIKGHVPDVAPYFARATLGVIPLRSGGGMRVKMIEMMSAGLPIVSTKKGAEGNMAVDGEHYLGAEDAPAFASAVVRLLLDAQERERLSLAGRTMAEKIYSLDVVSKSLGNLLAEATQRSRRRLAGARPRVD
jgi:polysaccharide biosynthesis protein PslH